MKVIGIYSICDFGGLEVLDFEYGIDDRVIYRYDFGSTEKIRKAKLHVNNKGVYFTPTRGGRVYLHNIIRV